MDDWKTSTDSDGRGNGDEASQACGMMFRSSQGRGIRRKPQVSDHELLRCIGQGSYGDIWLARNVMGIYRAVKVIWRDTFSEAAPYDREFAGIKNFEPISRSHPSLVEILHVGINETEGYFYYVMELADDAGSQDDSSGVAHAVSGSPLAAGKPIDPESYTPKTLRSEIRSRACIPVTECLKIAVDLAGALEHVHRHGLVHRDIKPSNIIVVGGRPKLADIGLVTQSDSARSFVGTEGFVPPEGPGKSQADIYSLGKVLYELVTGKDRLQYPEPPTTVRDPGSHDLCLGLNDAILKACNPAPSARYHNASDLSADLLALMAGKRRQSGRGGMTAWLAGGTVLLAAAALAIGWPDDRSPGGDPRAAVAPVNLSQGGAENTAVPGASPEASQPPAQAQAHADGINFLYFVSAQAGSYTEIDELSLTDLATGRVLVEDDFSTHTPGRWSFMHKRNRKNADSPAELQQHLARIEGGTMRLECVGFEQNGADAYESSAAGALASPLPESFSLTFRAKRNQWPGGFSICFAWSPTSFHAYEAHESPFAWNLYSISWAGSNFGITEAFDSATSTRVIVRDSSGIVSPFVWHTFEIRRENASLKAFVDGNLLQEDSLKLFDYTLTASEAQPDGNSVLSGDEADAGDAIN